MSSGCLTRGRRVRIIVRPKTACGLKELREVALAEAGSRPFSDCHCDIWG